MFKQRHRFWGIQAGSDMLKQRHRFTQWTVKGVKGTILSLWIEGPLRSCFSVPCRDVPWISVFVIVAN